MTDALDTTAGIVEAFLYHEAALLDDGRFNDWLDLFTDDAVYWVPQGQEQDPSTSVSIVYDDRRRLYERVLRLTGGFAFGQDPPSRTCHLVGNVRLTATDADGLDVRSSLIVAEGRRGKQMFYCGQVEHQLVVVDDGYRIRRKVVRLVTSDTPLGNVGFLI